MDGDAADLERDSLARGNCRDQVSNEAETNNQMSED